MRNWIVVNAGNTLDPAPGEQRVSPIADRPVEADECDCWEIQDQVGSGKESLDSRVLHTVRSLSNVLHLRHGNAVGSPVLGKRVPDSTH